MGEQEDKKGWISDQACLCIGKTCNLYCVYCHNPPNGSSMDRKKTVESVRRRGIKAVGLEGGGEPTTAPDFFEWIKELREAGVTSFMLSTNGLTCSDEKFCAEALDNIDYFTVNFPSHIKEVYQKVTRSVKYDTAVAGLRNLKRLGGEEKVRIFHIISSENYKYLPAFSDWVIENFPRVGLINFTFVRNKGRALKVSGIVPRYGKAALFIELALLKLKKRGIKAVIQNMPLCQIPKFEGFSFEFHRWRRGDKVLEDGIPDSAKLDVCSGCSLAAGCCGARPDYILVHGSGELKASDTDLNDIRPERF